MKPTKQKGKKWLTAKQKKRADTYIQTDNKTEAARIAYPKTTYNTQRKIWCLNTTKGNIIEYLKENSGIAASYMTSVIENEDDSTRDRITAAKDVLDRAWYKPIEKTQDVQVNINVEKMTPEELMALIKK